MASINNLAGYYRKIHDPKKSLEFSSRSLSLQPNNPHAKSQHAKALMYNNQPDEAIKMLERLTLDYPDNDDFKIDLSTAYREMGEIEKSNLISYAGFKKNFRKISYLWGYTRNKESRLNNEKVDYYESMLEDKDSNFDEKNEIWNSCFEYDKNKKDLKKYDE